MDKAKRWQVIKLLIKLTVCGLLESFFFFVWAGGLLGLAFGTPHAHYYQIGWTGVMLAIAFFTGGLIFGKKLLRRIAYGTMAVSLAVWGAMWGWFWWSIDRYPVVNQDVSWWLYHPNNPETKLVTVIAPEEYRQVGPPSAAFARVNGAYALYPIYAAMAKALYPAYACDRRQYIAMDGSDVIYEELLKDRRDLIFALAPSQKQQEAAAQAGLSYTLVPFCQDAFVFYVNAKNPIDNLTIEQIKGIYSGRITNWREVGSPVSTKIIPFQRNEGSGSQTTLQKLMGDTPIMPPLKEDRVGGMGEIINDTANYRNYNAAIGFSFRFYATELLNNNQIKLLSIEGVEPTVENIRNGSYPLTTTAYMVTVRPPSDNTQRIIDFMQSPTGQSLVKQTGYIPITE